MTLFRRAAASATLVAAALSAALPAEAGPLKRYDFLAGSRWFVPPATLPALTFNPATGRSRMVSDQTVWRIDTYEAGYFTGKAVTVLSAPGLPAVPAECSDLVGSVTPDGSVLIAFIATSANRAEGAVQGRGELKVSGARPRFTMQMATGDSALVAHWSFMDVCRPGDACETRLPGSRLGVDAFLAQCAG
jgi:hypothetical protein